MIIYIYINHGDIRSLYKLRPYRRSDGNECKKLDFSEPVKLSNIDEGTNISLDLCKVDENYELTSINLSK